MPISVRLPLPKSGLKPVLLAFALLLLAPAAGAAPVTVLMTGTWNVFEDTGGVLDGSVGLGTAFTLTFSYDDATPDDDPSSSAGYYLFGGGAYTLEIETGNYTISASPTSTTELALTVTGGGGGDLTLYTEGFDVAGPGSPSFGFLSYLNPSAFGLPAGTFSSDALVGLPWGALAGALNVYFFGSDDGVDFVELSGEPTSLTVVPEPGSAVLVALGLAWVGARRRRCD